MTRLPVVGSVWGWYWGLEEAEPKGRTFELASKSIKINEVRRSSSTIDNTTPPPTSNLEPTNEAQEDQN